MEKGYNKWGHLKGDESINFTKIKSIKNFLTNSVQGVIIMVPGSVLLLFFHCLTGGGSTCLHREFV